MLGVSKQSVHTAVDLYIVYIYEYKIIMRLLQYTLLLLINTPTRYIFLLQTAEEVRAADRDVSDLQ